MTPALLLSLIAVAIAGAIGHELMHWVVWVVTGRQPELDLWKLEVRPSAGPRETVLGDRVAAAAPYVTGGCCVALGWYSGALLVMVFGAAMIQLPSAADVGAMRGRVKWRVN